MQQFEVRLLWAFSKQYFEDLVVMKQSVILTRKGRAVRLQSLDLSNYAQMTKA